MPEVKWLRRRILLSLQTTNLSTSWRLVQLSATQSLVLDNTPQLFELQLARMTKLPDQAAVVSLLESSLPQPEIMAYMFYTCVRLSHQP